METFGGSGFPASSLGRTFVAEAGPTYATGRNFAKRITEFVIAADGESVIGPTVLVEYTDTCKATVSALAAGPDGLYFSDLYKDHDTTGPTDRGAQILRVEWVGE